MNTVVAIDGPSASGKSTTARLLAQRLGYLHLDTGAMYRAVTLACLQQGLAAEPSAQLDELLAALDIRFERGPDGEQHVLLNGVDASQDIRTPEISRSVSQYSALPTVRERLVGLQRAMALQSAVVCEGRDIGTRVFPEAAHKFFIVADPSVRARRRDKELQAAGQGSNFDEVLADLERRDAEDSRREHSPLVQARDAIVIDTSEMDIEQQVAAVLSHIKGRTESEQ